MKRTGTDNLVIFPGVRIENFAEVRLRFESREREQLKCVAKALDVSFDEAVRRMAEIGLNHFNQAMD